jgi:hypothetical protein
MGFCLGVLGWPPDVFWRATVPELKAAATGRRGADILEDADIRALEALLAGEVRDGDGN